MNNNLEYVSADGQRVVTFYEDALLDGDNFIWLPPIEGLLSSSAQSNSRRSINQIGESALPSTVGSRSVSFSVLIAAPTHEQTWHARQVLGDALWTQPATAGKIQELGVLRLYREGQIPVEIDAIAVNSPSNEQWDGHNSCRVDVEFWCADSRWRELGDTTIELRQGRGFSFPLGHKWMSESANVEKDVVNVGSADAPILVTISGALNTPRLRNLSTGKVFEISGSLTESQQLLIDTGYQKKSVLLYDAVTGQTTNALKQLNFSISELWSLRRGTNRIRFEANQNISGRAFVSYRSRYSGV